MTEKKAESKEESQQPINIRNVVTSRGANLAGLIAGPALCTLAGALGGEICDWLPYVQDTVPEMIRQVTTKDFYGELDKLGAAVGFAYSYFRV